MPRTPGYRVHPGVAAVLDALAGQPATALGLGTGNLREGARLKLARGALDARFGFGGFGCDAEDRATILRIGAARGAAQLGVGWEDTRVVVIGDTPRDVAAAASLGADCIAVCTSGSTPEELRAAGPCQVFATLDAPGVLDALSG
jgi:phosphoglycolate phosphatase-like HAD superfamily hydrolase